MLVTKQCFLKGHPIITTVLLQHPGSRSLDLQMLINHTTLGTDTMPTDVISRLLHKSPGLPLDSSEQSGSVG